jgi:hypothetical protein
MGNLTRVHSHYLAGEEWLDFLGYGTKFYIMAGTRKSADLHETGTLTKSSLEELKYPALIYRLFLKIKGLPFLGPKPEVVLHRYEIMTVRGVVDQQNAWGKAVVSAPCRGLGDTFTDTSRLCLIITKRLDEMVKSGRAGPIRSSHRLPFTYKPSKQTDKIGYTRNSRFGELIRFQ